MYTTDMKRLAVLLLTIFTIGTVAVCGCADTQKSSSDEIRADDIFVQRIEEVEEDQEGEQDNPECPDCKERDGECPTPRRPHKRHNKRLPRPKSAYRKDR